MTTSSPSSALAPGRLVGVGGVGEKSSMLAYLVTESRLMPSRRAISRWKTPWESSLLISSTTVMCTVIFFQIPSF